MPHQFSTFNFIALIAILLFSLMLIANQQVPLGKFAPPAPPEIQTVTIQQNENIYVYAAGKVAQLDDSGIKYFHNDYLGTPRVETNANKNIVASNNQYPFGEVLSSAGNERYRFTGKESDDSGLMYFGARFYDSSTGRFTQVDPVGAGYAYAGNNPLSFIDPTGKTGFYAQTNWRRTTWADVKAAWNAIEPIPYYIVWGDAPVNNLGSGLLSVWNFVGTLQNWADPMGLTGIGMVKISGGWGFIRPGKTYFVHPTENRLVGKNFPGAIPVSSDVAEVIVSQSGGVKGHDVSNFLYFKDRSPSSSFDFLLENAAETGAPAEGKLGSLAELPRSGRSGRPYDWSRWIKSGDAVAEVNFAQIMDYVNQAYELGYINDMQATYLSTAFDLLEEGAAGYGRFNNRAIANVFGVTEGRVSQIMGGTAKNPGAIGGFGQFLRDKEIIPGSR